MSEDMLYIPDFISLQEERTCLETVDSRDWYDRGGRQMQSYGFNYGKGEHDVPLREATPIPESLSELIDRINTTADRRFNQMTVNRYQPGQGIDAHWDHHVRFGDCIAGITLGSGCVMIFQKDSPDGETQKKEYYLKPRSLYLMRGDMRYNWKHRIAKVHQDTVDGVTIKRGTRTSLTFRIC